MHKVSQLRSWTAYQSSMYCFWPDSRTINSRNKGGELECSVNWLRNAINELSYHMRLSDLSLDRVVVLISTHSYDIAIHSHFAAVGRGQSRPGVQWCPGRTAGRPSAPQRLSP